MAAEEFGRAVHGDVRAEGDRLLQQRGGEGVIDRDQGAAGPCRSAQGWQVGDGEQRVSGRFQPHQVRAAGRGRGCGRVGDVDQVDVPASLLLAVGQQGVNSRVQSVGAITRAPAGRRSRTAAAAPMPEANATASPPSSSPATRSSASHPGVASSREYSRPAAWPWLPARKFDARTMGTFSGCPGSSAGRPAAIRAVCGRRAGRRPAGPWRLTGHLNLFLLPGISVGATHRSITAAPTGRSPAGPTASSPRPVPGLASSYLNLASTRSTVSRTPRMPGSIRPYGAVPAPRWRGGLRAGSRRAGR